MAKRGSRLKGMKKRSKKVGYWKIKKSGVLPPKEVVDRLDFKPLNYAKFKRVKG